MIRDDDNSTNDDVIMADPAKEVLEDEDDGDELCELVSKS
jgi:hypothetical protein